MTDKEDWRELQERIIKASKALVHKRGVEREEHLKKLVNMHNELMSNESLQGRPEWVVRSQEMDRRTIESLRKSKPLIDALKKNIDEQSTISERAKVSCWFDINLENFYVNIWYETDSNLFEDQFLGKHDELRALIVNIGKGISKATGHVRFYSSQTLQEKFGGNIREYV